MNPHCRYKRDSIDTADSRLFLIEMKKLRQTEINLNFPRSQRDQKVNF